MRILVLGATGYVGSRVVPALLDAGHEVVAASSSEPRPARFAWGDQVDWVRCDVTDADQVRLALTDVEGICYLVHSLNIRSFEDRDRRGALVLREAVAESDVRRVVYLSGLVPDVPVDDLSPHLYSRLEVEQVLEEAASETCSVLSLRAGVVLGAGSTSYEVIRQLSTLLLVQPVPSWLEHEVQPVAASDVMRAMVEAFASDKLVGAVDLGGPDVMPYARLLAESARSAGLLRLRVPILPLPSRAGQPGHRRAVRRSVLDRRGARREPAPRHGLPPGRDLGACRRRATDRRPRGDVPSPGPGRQQPGGGAAQRPRLDPDARPGPRRAARAGDGACRCEPGPAAGAVPAVARLRSLGG